MGAWGMRAFDNDTVLDAIGDLTDRTSVVTALGQVLDTDPGRYGIEDDADVAFGAAEVVAAARMGVGGYQSEGTTLFSRLVGQDRSAPYLPEEVREFIDSGRADFSDDDARLALRALDAVEGIDPSRGWSDVEQRAEEIADTRARLMLALLS